MQTIKRFLAALTRSNNEPSLLVKEHCNYLDNYYGDQRCDLTHSPVKTPQNHSEAGSLTH